MNLGKYTGSEATVHHKGVLLKLRYLGIQLLQQGIT